VALAEAHPPFVNNGLDHYQVVEEPQLGPQAHSQLQMPAVPAQARPQQPTSLAV